jgi:phosphoenolpyruvate-protein kinase (PTS system EI component)
VGRVRVGAMIEVPSAVLIAAAIAREVDFFSLGTNDLVQYTLAVDRGNDEVADWFRSLHPAVLQSIARALEAASAAGIPSNVCGEMAASPAYAAVLIGLGARELSMAPTSLARVRHMVAGIECTEVEALARECLTLFERGRGRGACARGARPALAESFPAGNLASAERQGVESTRAAACGPPASLAFDSTPDCANKRTRKP